MDAKSWIAHLVAGLLLLGHLTPDDVPVPDGWPEWQDGLARLGEFHFICALGVGEGDEAAALRRARNQAEDRVREQLETATAALVTDWLRLNEDVIEEGKGPTETWIARNMSSVVKRLLKQADTLRTERDPASGSTTILYGLPLDDDAYESYAQQVADKLHRHRSLTAEEQHVTRTLVRQVERLRVITTDRLAHTLGIAACTAVRSEVPAGGGDAVGGAAFGGGIGRRGVLRRSPGDAGRHLELARIFADLDMLEGLQSPDGSWGTAPQAADVGVTSVVLLAFLGVRSTPGDGNYRDAVARGVEWLRSRQNPATGSMGGPEADILERILAATVLCECFALTGDDELEVAANAALASLGQARSGPAAWSSRYTSYAREWFLSVASLASEYGLSVDAGLVERELQRLEGSLAGGLPDDPHAASPALLADIFLDPNLERPGHMDRIREMPRVIAKAPLDPAAIESLYWTSYMLYQVGGRDFSRWAERLDGEFAEGLAGPGPTGLFASDVDARALAILVREVRTRYDTVIGSR